MTTTPNPLSPSTPAPAATATAIPMPVVRHGDIVITGHAAANLAELLELCETFLRTASDAVRTELEDLLTTRPDRPDAPRPHLNWLIDMLGFNALYLHSKLALTADPAADSTGGAA